MKKFLFLITLLTLMGGANSVKAIALGDEITSLGGITDGTKFIISDGTKAKYFYNSGAANEIKYANVGDVPAEAYCYFTLEKYDGSEVSGDNIYWIKITDADGNVYPNGTNGGYYLNTIVNNGDVVISAQKAGWGGSTSALWKVTYDAEKGFSFQSVWKEANSGNSWLAINNNNFVADQQYLKLYSKSTDPLALQKAALESAINLGGKYSSFAKTEESWNALQDAISDGEDELDNSSTTTDRLTAATTAINDAIAGLKLEPGYTNLTKNMYKTWDSATVPTESTDASESCIYVLNESTGQPYGDPSVKWYHYADISDFTSLIILAPAGTPRVMMNRAYAEAGDGGDYVEIKNAPVDGKVSIDLTAYDYAHLNAIKEGSWGAKVTVSDMLLYRTINVSSAGVATFGSLYKSAKLNGVKAYAAKFDGEKLTLTEVTNVPAGKGVIIEAEAGSYAPTFDVEADDIDSELKVSNGTVVGDGSTIYVLAKGANGIGFYLLENGYKLEAGKAYLKVPALGARSIRMVYDNITGVNEVKAKKEISNGVYYNLNGQRVSNPTKGLYIVDGKKVVVE